MPRVGYDDDDDFARLRRKFDGTAEPYLSLGLGALVFWQILGGVLGFKVRER